MIIQYLYKCTITIIQYLYNTILKYNTILEPAMIRDGVEVHGSEVALDPLETRPLLLQVPPGYNPGEGYRLRIEGYNRSALHVTPVISGRF